MPALRFAPPLVTVERRHDGSMVLRSPMTLGPCPPSLGHWLVQWSREAPDRVFLADRAGASWRTVTFAEAFHAARTIGQALLDRGLDGAHPVAILSDNSVDHALVALGAMHVGVPVVPISPAYSLVSTDHAKLKAIFRLVRPGLVFATDTAKFAPALEALERESTPMAELLTASATAEVEKAFARVGPATLAKILFTSGSTGEPKGVINTQRMLTANQQMLAQGWPFVEDRPPVVVDWLPWSHTFGGNHNFNLVLRNGGSLYIDGGKPAPGLIDTTVRNLREIAPTMYFNVPRGFDLLLPFLESDAALRHKFFRHLDMLFYAGSALPQNLWQRIETLASAEHGRTPAMLSAWGSTETSPLATQVHFAIDRAGVVGLPAAGCEIKLVPSAGKLEARVRGPHVTPGYFKNDGLTRAAFDDEGFYRIGDALRLADPAAPSRGLVFDGRVAEDFKLTTGTWVHAGAVRLRLIAAGDPLIQDAVITGHDRDDVGALVFLSAAATGMEPAAIRERIAAALATLAGEPGGSSRCPVRAMVMTEALSIDAGEITDKGYINQRAVLERRAALVGELYSGGPNVVRP
ncbi:MAG: feruloyl-CoA synthase [Vicinamibacterales bacterium]